MAGNQAEGRVFQDSGPIVLVLVERPRPPHFHAKKEGEWEIRVKFTEAEEQMFESVWGDEPSGKFLRRLRKAVIDNRDDLLAEWEANVNQ